MLIMIKTIVFETIIIIKKIISHILWFRAPIDRRKIVVDNFLGKGFGDNPKYIIEKLHDINPEFKIIWNLKDISQDMPSYIKKVKYGSLKSLYEYHTSILWIDNVRNSIHPIKKRDGQYYIQTWHGLLPLKNIENQADNLNKRYINAAKRDSRQCDAILSSNSVLSSIMQKDFWLENTYKIVEFGSPETDIFFDKVKSVDAKGKVRKFYNIEDDAQIVLYMPTFRDDMNTNIYDLDFISIKNVFENKTNKKCYILVRLHPNIKNDSFIDFSESIISATKYPDANEILIASDWLISDYSGIIYINVLLSKFAILYVPDLEKYLKIRGLNDCYHELPCPRARTEQDIMKIVEHFDKEKYIIECERFNNFIKVYNLGTSASVIAKWINKLIYENWQNNNTS